MKLKFPMFSFNGHDVTEHVVEMIATITPDKFNELAIGAHHVCNGVMVYNGAPIIDVHFWLPNLDISGWKANQDIEMRRAYPLVVARGEDGEFTYTLAGEPIASLGEATGDFSETYSTPHITMRLERELDLRQYAILRPRQTERDWLKEPLGKTPVPASFPPLDAQGHKLIQVTVPRRVREIAHSIAQQVQEAHMLGWYVGVGYEAIQPPEMRANFIQIDAQPHFQNYYSKTEIRPKGVCVNIKTGPFYE